MNFDSPRRSNVNVDPIDRTERANSTYLLNLVDCSTPFVRCDPVSDCPDLSRYSTSLPSRSPVRTGGSARLATRFLRGNYGG